MKKLLLLIPILFLAGCFFQPFFKAETKFGSSKNRLTKKYDLATEIKSKYQLDGASLKKTAKDDPKDIVRVELGDTEAAEFIPNLKISRWDEVSFKIKPKDLDKIASADKTVNFNGDKIELITPKIDYKMYELPISEENPEGAFEYEIDLKEKPVANVVELDIETQGLDFFYQPALTQEEIDSGNVMPENVIGSYAVYTSEEKINWDYGKKYKAGKVGHIYRPKIIDANGEWVWADMKIENALLTITIPQKFLDNGIYPITVDPTIGYTSVGAIQDAPNPNQMLGVKSWFDGNIYIDSISFYGKYFSSGYQPNVKVVLWNGDTTNIVTNGIGNIINVNSDTNQWWRPSDYSSKPNVVAGTNYIVGFIVDNYGYFNYDTSSNGSGADNVNNYATPGTANLNSTQRMSIYATFTEPARTITTADYTYCRTLTTNNNGYTNGIATTTPSLFPLIATSTVSELAATSSSGHVQLLDSTNNTPIDVVFGDEASCWAGASISAIPHYFEKYASSTGAFTVHLGTSNISSTTAKVLTMYYGNSSAVNLNSPGQVYATTSPISHAGVWDLSVPGYSTTTMPDFSDSTYNQNNGTSANATGTVSLVDGMADGAFQFDGLNDYIQVDATNQFYNLCSGSSGCTFSAWAKVTVSGTNLATVIGRWDNVNDCFFQLYVDGFSRAYFRINNDGVTTTCSSNSTGYSYDAWHHIVGVYTSASTSQIYVDGILRDADACAITINKTAWQDTEPTDIGMIKSNTYPMKGAIDDVRIYRRGLTVQDIKTIYNNTRSSTVFWTIAGEETQSAPVAVISDLGEFIIFDE